MKEYLAIHDFKYKYFDLPLSEYTLTFDDALFSQFYYWPIIQEVKTDKILSISTSFIDIKGEKRSQFDILNPVFIKFPNTFECLRLFRNGEKTNYMRLSEILSIKEDLTIAGHGHNHYKNYDSTLKNKIDIIRKDTEQMLEWFNKNLNLIPTIYTYPHYEEDIILKAILKTYGFTTFIGKRREIENEQT